MPIRPENRALYPADWPEVRERIRERAAGPDGIERCEWCGVRNHAAGWRDGRGRFHELDPDVPGESCAALADGLKIIEIVCTVAHWDHDPTNNDDRNLFLLCQRCHNSHDGKQRAAGIRRRRDERVGQGLLFEVKP